MKPLLVGEYNPLSVKPEHALYPFPPGCAGARLCAAFGMTPREYLAAFDRRNLLVGSKYRGTWSVRDARLAASSLLEDLLAEENVDERREPVRRPIVLLGRRVSDAFRVVFRPLEATCFEGPKGRYQRVLVLPHPSGRCRLWNKPGVKEAARAAVLELLR